MPTTDADMKELVERVNKEIYREGNLELIDELFAEDYVEHNPVLPHDIQGREDLRDKVRMFQSAFSNASGETEDIVVEGNKVAERHRFIATHDGEFMDIEPTGNEIEVVGMTISRIEDGQIAETWIQADTMGMMEQLGVQ